MQKLIFGIILGAALFTPLAVSCGDDSQTKEEYETEVQDQVNALEKRIQDLEKEVSGQGGADAEAGKRLDDLRNQRDDLKGKLGDLRARGDDNWQDLKKEIDPALDRVNKELDELGKKIGDAIKN